MRLMRAILWMSKPGVNRESKTKDHACIPIVEGFRERECEKMGSFTLMPR